MRRRKFLSGLTVGLAGLAGCTEGVGTETGGGAGGDADTTTEPESGGSTDSPTATESGEESPTSSGGSSSGGSDYQVRIKYTGKWSGSIATADKTRSIEGEGTKTLDVKGDPTLLAANAQKDGDGSDKLTVQILKDGEVVKESSTTAAYGLAQVSLSGSGSGSGSDDSGSANFAVVVDYSGEWSGAISAGGSSRSIEGSGKKELKVEGSPSIISANAQKKDDSGDKLTIKILKDGKVVKESSTSAEYGMASVTYSNF